MPEKKSPLPRLEERDCSITPKVECVSHLCLSWVYSQCVELRLPQTVQVAVFPGCYLISVDTKSGYWLFSRF